MHILLTGGGTGGHVMPFEPIISALRSSWLTQKKIIPKRLNPSELTIRFIGVGDETVEAFFAAYTIPTQFISAGKLRRYASGLTIIDLLFRLPWGILTSLVALWRFMPDVIVSKGGYGSLPVTLAGAFYRIPILIHESDATLGLANRIAARLAAAIAVSFPQMLRENERWRHKMILTGLPVRQPAAMDSVEAKQKFRLPADEHVLLVTGGSQGAQQINEVLLKVLPRLILETSIIHITGAEHFDAVATVAQELLANSSRRDFYRVYPYLADQMSAALVAADSVVARAGANTLQELAALQKPALIIPLAGAANDHQRKNAQAYEAVGAALVLDPSNATEHLFFQNVMRLISDETTRQSLVKNVASLARPAAAAELAHVAWRLAKGEAPVKHT